MEIFLKEINDGMLLAIIILLICIVAIIGSFVIVFKDPFMRIMKWFQNKKIEEEQYKKDQEYLNR
jgi:uncharacterized protein YpmB